MYQPPSDAAAVDALEPDARLSYLGNTLYPGIFALIGEPCASKVTGMLLEMPTQAILDCLGSEDTLKTTVDRALEVLPEELRATACPPPPAPPSPTLGSPAVVSPVSVMAGASNDGWADDDENENLPSVGELFASVEKKRVDRTSACSDAMDTDEWSPEWDADAMAAEPSDKLAEWIAARLQEQLRIPRAVVEVLGASTALRILSDVERIQASGGMLVEETGRMRTSGGIFIKLLKEATYLPAGEQAMTIERIKREGNEAKKSQQAKKNAAKYVHKAAAAPLTPTSAGRPKVELAEFMDAALRRQQSV